MSTLRPEARDPGIQSMIFQELYISFDTDPQYWSGTQNSYVEDFMGMVSDLGKVRRGNANDTIQQRVFTQLKSLESARSLSRRTKGEALAFIELFFAKIQPITSHSNEEAPCRATSERLIIRLCTLTGENIKIQEPDPAVTGLLQLLYPVEFERAMNTYVYTQATQQRAKTDIKTRVAAYRLLHQLINPVTVQQFEAYKEENPIVKQHLAEFGQTAAALSIEFPKAPPEPPSLEDLRKAEQERITNENIAAVKSHFEDLDVASRIVDRETDHKPRLRRCSGLFWPYFKFLLWE